MGFRTVVILNNDEYHQWSKDPKLGELIASASNSRDSRSIGNYGRVVEVADTSGESLLHVSHLHANSLACLDWSMNRCDPDVSIALLRQAADKLGYRLTKKPATKEAA